MLCLSLEKGRGRAELGMPMDIPFIQLLVFKLAETECL